MIKKINDFEKKHDFIVCIDSDGSAIDSMNVKHYECFAPCLIKEFSLEEQSDLIIKKWAEINLFSLTRGVNRFKTLFILLDYVDKNINKVDDISALESWVLNTTELSNSSLKKEIDLTTDSSILKKSLTWSLTVNESIEKLPKEKKKAYSGVYDFLVFAKSFCDIAIVSSANYEALLTEWKDEKLIDFVDVIMSQNDGSKKHCIKELLMKGYSEKNVLMIGDAPTDLTSALDNQVYFYPILVNNEVDSWKNLTENALSLFLSSNYDSYAVESQNEFYQNLIKD